MDKSEKLNKIIAEIEELEIEKDKITSEVSKKFKLWNKCYAIRELLYNISLDHELDYIEKVKIFRNEIKKLLFELDQEIFENEN